MFYTDLINQMVIDDKARLSIFDKNGLYLATKKIGKNNPKAEEIRADNEIRMEWNRTVYRAIVYGISETEVLELKKTEITDRIKESVEQNAKRPELFRDIVRVAILLLERLITKVIKELYAAKKENSDYKTARAEWEKTYGNKVVDSMSVRDRLRQKEQIVKEKEVNRDYGARQKDKGAR